MHVDSIHPEPPPIQPIPNSGLNVEFSPIAPWPHTVALFVLLLGTALLGQQRGASIASSIPHWYRYASSILLTWMLLGSVVAGIYRRRAFFVRALDTHISTLLHEAWFAFAIYLAGLALLGVVGQLTMLTPLAHKRNSAVVLAMMPHTAFEFLAWLALSLTAGFCEELVFRGYLLQQFTAWTKRPMLAIVLSSILFGSVHLYEGLGATLPLMALALLYCFVVRQRKGDLRAVIIAHALQDFFVAFLVFAHPWLQRHAHTHP